MVINYGVMEDILEAVEAFGRVIEIDPNFDKAYYAMGLAYWYQEDFQQAVTAFEQATKINEKPYYYWRYLGLSYRYLRHSPRALAAYNRAIQRNQSPGKKKDFVALCGTGGMYSQDLERYEEAVASYSEAINIKPNHIWAYLQSRRIPTLNLEQYH